MFPVRLLACLVLPLTMLMAADGPATKPNIIFILSDDVGLGNIGCYGGHYPTPNIDALAKGGTRFEYCYANPVCGPSRATCLTGRYVFRTGMLTNGYTERMNRAEIMLPRVMKPAGYVTASVGKWDQIALQPSDWGFDEYLRFEGSGKYWSSQVKTYTENGKEKEVGDRYIPDLMHEFLVDFITRHKDQPFYIHYPLSHMHSQILPTPDSKATSRSKSVSQELYDDNNAYMDKLVGKLVTELEKLGLREKTLLIFVGDNGTAHEAAPAATVDGRAISGMKGTMLEGGSRVPLIANWPGTTPAGKVNHDLTDFTDFMPTFAEFAGAKLPAGVKIDGHSFASQIKGQSGTPRDWVYVQLAGERYLRDARWKLTGTGEFIDLKDAPFTEVPVAADSTDADARGSREKLLAVLDDIKSQDKITGDTPARTKNKKKKNEGTDPKMKREKKKEKRAATEAAERAAAAATGAPVTSNPKP